MNRCAGREKFTQLKKYLNIKEQPEIEAGKIEPLKKAIVGLQEQLAEQRLITNTISEENVRTKKEFEKLRPLLDFIAKANSDDLRTYIGAWLETEECRAATAKEHGKPDKRIIKLALTDDQVAQFGKFSDDMSIELAKVLQRAHDFLYTCQTSSSISILTIPYHLHGQFMKTMDDRVDTWCRKTDHSDTKKEGLCGRHLQTLLTCTEDQVDVETLKMILDYAGSAVGIGDYRPRFGGFTVTQFTESE